MAKRATSYQRSKTSGAITPGGASSVFRELIVDVAGNQVGLIFGIDAVHGHPMTNRSLPLTEFADAFPLQETGGYFGKNVLEF